jgi:hypothetical protein
VGPIVAGVLLAETGDPKRFASPHHFASYGGAAPKAVATAISLSCRERITGRKVRSKPEIEAAIERYQAALAVEHPKFGMETKPGRLERKASSA